MHESYYIVWMFNCSFSRVSECMLVFVMIFVSRFGEYREECGGRL